jgi:GNAT superfamily N-acetyltransferase
MVQWLRGCFCWFPTTGSPTGIPSGHLLPYASSERAPDPRRCDDRRVSATTVVRRLLPHERDPALATVVAAFATDPLLRWVWPDDGRYAEVAPAFFGLLLDLRMESGEAWAADGDGAVAMWDPPGGLYVPAREGRWAEIQTEFTPREREQWAAYDHTMAVPPHAGPHWYLGVLAADPARKRTGLGSAVVAPMLGAADRARLPAYLETASEVNLAFYARHGFTPVSEATMDAGPRCWLLRREPREAT